MRKAIDHSKREHALLSASGASRWLNCTPSPRLEDTVADTSSVYAREGTLAHEFAELNLRLFAGKLKPTPHLRQLRKLRKHSLYTSEMEAQVKKYTDFIEAEYLEAVRVNGSAELSIEERLDFSYIVPEGFGTGDACIVSDKVLTVNDLKYGKGIKVSAVDNPQLKLYGLGALNAYDMVYDIETVRLIVTQPRLDNISIFEISVEDLVAWGTTVVKPTAATAFKGEGEQVSGDWCQWCAVKATCRKLADENLALAKLEFTEPELMSKEDLVAVFSKIDKLTFWAKAVKEHVLEQARSGEIYPGYKLVEGSSRRSWTDPEGVAKVLRGLKIGPSKIYNKKLKGIGDISQLLSVDQFNELLGAFIVLPQGKLSLVPESDARPAFGKEQAKIDFAEDIK